MFLGFDTSNYKTSVALFDGKSLSVHKSKFLDVESGSLGLRQSDALFKHVKNLPELIKNVFHGEKYDLKAVGVSTRPRTKEGSYMPCFAAGELCANAISSSHGIDCYNFSHQDGHIVAAAYSANCMDLLKKEFVCLHISGGTTEILKVSPHPQNIISTEIVGGTSDISAGQLVDRAGVLLGFSFPCGKHMEEHCKDYDNIKAFSPKVLNGVFSLSGVENKIKHMFENGETASSIAGFTFKTIENALVAAIYDINKEKLPILCSGGVLANSFISKRLKKEFEANVASAELSGDNALGIAVLTALKYSDFV